MDRRTDLRDGRNYIPLRHTLYAGGIIKYFNIGGIGAAIMNI